MGKNQFGLMMVLAVVAGLVAGAISQHIFMLKRGLAANDPPPRKVLVAEEFRMVDQDGKVLAMLGMYAGGPGIVLFDSAGKFRAVFSLTSPEENPVLSFVDHRGEHRATVGMRANGEPSLALRGSNGKVRLSMLQDKMVLYGGDGKITWTAP